MTHNTLKEVLSICAFIVACFCAIMGIFLPPTGVIHPSILYLTAQFLVFIAGILGLDIKFKFGDHGFETKTKIKSEDE